MNERPPKPAQQSVGRVGKMQQIAIVGSGVVASMWAVRSARGGCRVRLLSATHRTRSCLRSELRRMVIRNQIPKEDVEGLSALISFTRGLRVDDCDMVIEAFDQPIFEKDFFRDLSERMSPGAILALCTTPLLSIVSEVKRPEQVVALRMGQSPLARVESMDCSAPGAVEATRAFCRSLVSESLAGAA